MRGQFRLASDEIGKQGFEGPAFDSFRQARKGIIDGLRLIPVKDANGRAQMGQ